MSYNSLQKAQQTIIRRVYKHTAKVSYHVRANSYDSSTGKIAENEYVFTRSIHVSNPTSVSEYLVSNGGYLAGDLFVDVSYKELLDALESITGDPTVVLGEVTKSLLELRGSEKLTGGIKTESDTIELNDVIYKFIKITQKRFWYGLPYLLRFQLREVNNNG